MTGAIPRAATSVSSVFSCFFLSPLVRAVAWDKESLMSSQNLNVRRLPGTKAEEGGNNGGCEGALLVFLFNY